jgi:DNA sulfur modification protein DndE
MIDTIRLSERARQQLITLKRYTSIQNWNILCRWAFCLSLREPSVPPDEEIPVDSSVEMSWRTFAGANEQVYWAVFIARAKRDNIDPSRASLNRYFRLHLHRGISYLASGQIRNVRDLVRLAA